MAKIVRYVNFSDRILELNIDGVLIGLFFLALWKVTSILFGDILMEGWVIIFLALHFIYFTTFLYFKQVTPAMMYYRQHLVDDKTLGRATLLQIVIRYFASFVSPILGLGYLWMLVDQKKGHGMRLPRKLFWSILGPMPLQI
tara:strand:+ start:327 stop:752 length:426 start_codon:yes stop_codon:yes gene_type:complete